MRAHVAARRPREVVSPAQTRGALEAFKRAIETGDLQHLLDILAPDVVLLGDGGGVKAAALEPVVGATTVADLLCRVGDTMSLQLGEVNGYPALIVRVNGELETVMAVDVEDGLVTRLYAVRNPEKLSHMENRTVLHR